MMVDLFTIDEEFYNLVARHFKIKREDGNLDDSDPDQSVFYCKNLDYNELRRFIKKNKGFSYEIRTKEGDYIEIENQDMNINKD